MQKHVLIAISLCLFNCQVLARDLPAIGDLQLLSLELVEDKEPTDIIMPNAQHPTGPSRRQIKLRFAVEGDLFRYIKFHEYNIGIDAFLCVRGIIDNKKPLDSTSYIFDDRGLVDPYRTDIAHGVHQQSGHVFRAYIYMQPVPRSGTHNVFEKETLYDLLREPKDVCLQLRGGNMLGGVFKTNRIIITEQMILDAIAKSDFHK